jgi:hypothetical protein
MNFMLQQMILNTRSVGGLFSSAMNQEQGNTENVKCQSPSSFEALFPLGHNDLRTKVMKDMPSAVCQMMMKKESYEI